MFSKKSVQYHIRAVGDYQLFTKTWEPLKRRNNNVFSGCDLRVFFWLLNGYEAVASVKSTQRQF